MNIARIPLGGNPLGGIPLGGIPLGGIPLGMLTALLLSLSVSFAVAAGDNAAGGGARLFATDSRGIVEIDPATGAVLNSFATPADRGVADGLAYDGVDLWYLSGSRAPNELYRLDPDDGRVVGSYTLPASAFRNALAARNGRVYLLDWSALTQDITVFDPALPGVVATLDIDGSNDDAPAISGGLAAIAGPDALLLTTALTGEVLQVDPVSGRIEDRFEHGEGAGASGLAVVDGQILLARNSSDTLAVYDRTGNLLRRVTVADSGGMQSLGGDESTPDPTIFADSFETD